MSALALDVRLDGHADPIGKLTRKISGDVSFSYTNEHLALGDPKPLSLSLPLREQEYGDVITRAYFNNLLQERDQPLKAVMERYGIEITDVVGLLNYLGADCAGAVSILPEGSAPTKVPGNLTTDYVELSQVEFEGIVRALHERTALPNELRDPSPLAGVQSKISILQFGENSFALPKPGTGAPTTHVLKVPDRQHHAEPERESLALMLSTLCGIHTVLPTTTQVADIPILLTPRFDRGFDDAGRIIRFHQEDFAQALSLPPSLKYERRGIEGRRFDALAIGRLLNETANPDLARNAVLKLTLFDLMVGNVDGHAKNHALLYNSRHRPNLSPRYDVLPTRLDDQFTDEFSYRIGTSSKLEEVDQQQFFTFMSNIGILRMAAQKRLLAAALDQIVTILADQLGNISSMNQKSFADLIAANMRLLLPQLGYTVPKQAIERDAHVVRGGGWLTS
jgi:serine/threonine-protein kinase HipA